ncbi:hypothetical protein F5H01DRAFT_139364 [Linnemannia elongata]|nr:hypothetical protein F5H01DRAFT_139364 [Linnemannia elongata]
MVHNTCASPAHPILNHSCILFFGHFFQQLVMNNTESPHWFCFLPVHTLPLSVPLSFYLSPFATHATLPCLLIFFVPSLSSLGVCPLNACFSVLYSLLFFCLYDDGSEPGHRDVQGRKGARGTRCDLEERREWEKKILLGPGPDGTGH